MNKETVTLKVDEYDFDYMRDGFECYEFAVGAVNEVLKQLGYQIQFEVELVSDEDEQE